MKEKLSGEKNKKKIVDFLSPISIVILVGIFTLINPNFLSLMNINNILTDAAPILMVASGVTFVLLIGSIDLSVGSICSCACVLTGLGIVQLGNLIIPFVLIFGLFAGVLNGFLFTQLKIPSFIVTLCTMNIWKCVALIISGGAPTGIPLDLWSHIKWAKISFGVIPILFVFGIMLLALLFFIQIKTGLGKSIYAVGANERAARIMGIKVMRTKMWPFVFSGFGAAFSGILYAIVLKSSLPTIGDSLTLMAIAAVALGGTPLTGGKGSVLKTLLGVVLVIII
ncbi:MAG: ABC transporter permease, partial [Lachnospiraceae bacterium]|nr:ABC transporter permease [Lachnospiraceae bacterium]